MQAGIQNVEWKEKYTTNIKSLG